MHWCAQFDSPNKWGWFDALGVVLVCRRFLEFEDLQCPEVDSIIVRNEPHDVPNKQGAKALRYQVRLVTDVSASIVTTDVVERPLAFDPSS